VSQLSETGLDVETPLDSGTGQVGSSVVHGEFRDKVRGSLLYAADHYSPGMLHGKIVRSSFSSAHVVSIDTSEARALPGVIAVLVADDVPHNVMGEEASGLGLETIRTSVLADGRVRYTGEPVAVIAAETPYLAEAAAELVEVEYEPMPGVDDPEDALADDAPLVHDQGNVLSDWRIGRGDVDSAIEAADHVIEGTYRTQAVDHAYLEPEAGVGWIDVDGVVTLRVATQVIEHATEVAAVLGLPHNRVRVMSTYMGGGFGGKEDMTVEPFLALLVWKTQRPVRMVWSRQESLLARPKRHPIVMRYRTAANSDGTVVAQDIDIVGDAGAYPYLSPRVLFAAAVTAVGPYRVDHVRIRSRAVFTNQVPNSAFRGFGAMQVVFGYEGQMDRLAVASGLTREEVRFRNFLAPGDALPTGEPVPTVPAVADTMRRALDALATTSAAEDGHLARGRGFACNMQPYGRTVFFGDKASAWIGFEADGTVIVRAGVTDLGGGQAASLAQIAAEVLGVDTSRVAVHIGDTHLTPLTGGTFATRQLYMSGNAVLKAAMGLRDEMAPVAARLLGVDTDDLEFAESAVRTTTGGAELSFSEWVSACAAEEVATAHLGTFHGETGSFDSRTGQGRTFPDYTFGTHAVDIEVDTETGTIKILDYVACHDVGRAINPLRVEGQIQGGVAQGLGYALSEEVLGEDGSSLFADYLIPTSMDLPDIIPLVLEEEPGKGPFGARGIGEPTIAPVAAAVASALEDAVGVRPDRLPFTPERVLEAIRAQYR